MWWVLILLIVLIAAFAVPKFGKALLAVIGILVVIGVALKDKGEIKGSNLLIDLTNTYENTQGRCL